MAEKKFEQALRRLEEISQILESGTKSLDESIELFEESHELARFCKEKLEKAENKVQILTKQGDTFFTDDAVIE
jgi:exodeoxyribonuclease VII small subunit